MIPAGQRPPHKDIKYTTQHKPVAWAAIVILAILAFIFAFLMWQCTGLVVEKLTVARTLSPVEKAEHDRLLRKHGLDGFSVVLWTDKGKFFERDGREVRFR